jgi:hypothetical protein
MRVWILVSLLPCALLAQTSYFPTLAARPPALPNSPPRPADQEVLQKLQQRLDWFQPGTHTPQGDWRVRLFAPDSASLPGGAVAVNTPSKACSIPLVRVTIAPGAVDHMSLPTPPGKDFDPKFVLPAPPVCEAWKP